MGDDRGEGRLGSEDGSAASGPRRGGSRRYRPASGDRPSDGAPGRFAPWAELATEGIHHAIVLSLLVIAAVVLVRTVATFLVDVNGYPTSLINGLDGILVAIILLDILRTVRSHTHGDTLPIKPFLVIGVLAAIRDILSASAHLTLGRHLSPTAFDQALIELSVSVGVILALLGGLVLLRLAARDDPALPRPGHAPDDVAHRRA